MINHGTVVMIMANHDTGNAVQYHGKITMVCHGFHQGYYVKNSMNHCLAFARSCIVMVS